MTNLNIKPGIQDIVYSQSKTLKLEGGGVKYSMSISTLFKGPLVRFSIVCLLYVYME